MPEFIAVVFPAYFLVSCCACASLVCVFVQATVTSVKALCLYFASHCPAEMGKCMGCLRVLPTKQSTGRPELQYTPVHVADQDTVAVSEPGVSVDGSWIDVEDAPGERVRLLEGVNSSISPCAVEESALPDETTFFTCVEDLTAADGDETHSVSSPNWPPAAEFCEITSFHQSSGEECPEETVSELHCLIPAACNGKPLMVAGNCGNRQVGKHVAFADVPEVGPHVSSCSQTCVCAASQNTQLPHVVDVIVACSGMTGHTNEQQAARELCGAVGGLDRERAELTGGSLPRVCTCDVPAVRCSVETDGCSDPADTADIYTTGKREAGHVLADGDKTNLFASALTSSQSRGFLAEEFLGGHPAQTSSPIRSISVVADTEFQGNIMSPANDVAGLSTLHSTTTPMCQAGGLHLGTADKPASVHTSEGVPTEMTSASYSNGFNGVAAQTVAVHDDHHTAKSARSYYDEHGIAGCKFCFSGKDATTGISVLDGCHGCDVCSLPQLFATDYTASSAVC